MSNLEGKMKKMTFKNITDVICCPGGVEVEHEGIQCDISSVVKWKKKMFESGMEGIILYQEEEPTGFIEYMPVESAPYPIEGKNIAVIMCFHWACEGDNSDDHHDVEKNLLKGAIDEIKNDFEAAAAIAWDHPIHFPLKLFESVGFSEVSSQAHISLMSSPFGSTGKKPELLGPNFEADDLSNEGKLAVELGYSNRCPYSINDHAKVKEAISELDDDRIVFRPNRIDTKKEAIEFSRRPWSWNWLLLNGEEIDHMKKSREELKDIIEKKLEELTR